MTLPAQSERVTVVLWRGTHRNDALERIETLCRICPFVYEPRLRGASGDWRVVGDVREDHVATDQEQAR